METTTLMQEPRKVMLIDDDDIDNYVNQKLILTTGFSDTIHCYKNPEKALNDLCDVRWMDRNRPDVIFLDMNMPRMNGIEFLEAFTKIPEYRRSGISVVVLSNSIHLPERLRDFDCVVACFSKPLIQMNLDRLEQIESEGEQRSSVFARGFSFFQKRA